MLHDDNNATFRASVKLVCKAGEKILLIRKTGNDYFNLVGGGIDQGESIETAIQRELFEETGQQREQGEVKLLYAEVKEFSDTTHFDGVLNLFYLLEWENSFEVKLEEGVYQEYKWVDKAELSVLAVSEHSNKEFLLGLL